MKTVSLAGLVASALFAQQAVATYGWNKQQYFPNPDSCDNKCSPDQNGGWDFGDLNTGDFNSYKDFDFKGFSCKDSFKSGNGKRGLTVRTNFKSKCIEAKATRGDDCPSFSHKKDGFSITKMHVSVDKDSDLEFHYQMPNGDTCKHVAKCSTSGTVVKNDQCGGAKSVKVKGDCNFGMHKIDFDCSPPKNTPPPQTSKTTTTVATTQKGCGPGYDDVYGSCIPKPTTSAPGTTTTQPPKDCGKESTLSSGVCVPKTVMTPGTTECAKPSTMSNGQCVPPATTTLTCEDKSTMSNGVCVPKTVMTPGTTQAPSTSPVSPGTSKCGDNSTIEKGYCVPIVTTTPVATTPATTPVATTTECGKESSMSGSVCVPKTVKTPGTTQATTTTTPSSPVTTTLATSSAPPPDKTSEVPCPNVLPRCMYTWLSLVAECKSNSDADCFCPSSDYVAKVQECVSAWGKDDSEVQSALSYLVGICAKYVPQNPGICTGVPTTITITQPSSPNPSTPVVPVPVTTITYTVTYTTGGSVESTSSVVTVPQVDFATESAGPSATGVAETGVGLVPAPASTSVGPVNTGSGTTSGPIATFTGAAVPLTVNNLGLAGVFGLVALLF